MNLTADVSVEVWKPVKGFNGYYEVSNLGNVKSIDRIIESDGTEMLYRGVLLKKSDVNGYEQVRFSKNGKSTRKYVHQVVAESFLGHEVCGHKIVIDHINGVKNDNRVSNLRLVSSKDNINFYWDTVRESESKTILTEDILDSIEFPHDEISWDYDFEDDGRQLAYYNNHFHELYIGDMMIQFHLYIKSYEGDENPDAEVYLIHEFWENEDKEFDFSGVDQILRNKLQKHYSNIFNII